MAPIFHGPGEEDEGNAGEVIDSPGTEPMSNARPVKS